MKPMNPWAFAATALLLFCLAAATLLFAERRLWISTATCALAFVGICAGLYMAQTRQLKILYGFIRGKAKGGSKERPRMGHATGKAVSLEQKYCGDKLVRNTIQTNGTLITPEFASFFKENDFLVGISIDGPRDIHDKYRKDKGGAPTFDKVIRGINLLYQYGVQYNTMSTVNKAGEGRGLEVYQFLKQLGTRFMQFMPVVEHIRYPLSKSGKPDRGARPYIVDPLAEGAQIAPWSVSSRGFGKFMCDIFDWWVRNDVGRYFVNLFDCTLANWCGAQPGTCAYAETCGGNSVIEHNGDLYSCDHFVYPQYRVGNIMETSLREMMGSDVQSRFGIDKRNGLPYKCIRCKYFFACHGECPKHRFNRTESGETGLSALCEGYYMFYSHVAPYMDMMKELLLQKKAPAGVIPWARMRKV